MGAQTVPAQEWFTAARAGDGRAFEAMLNPVLEPAFRLAMVMLRDRAAAEDATQEAALKAWRKLDRFRPEADFRPWFLAIVANECRTTRRSRWLRLVPLPLDVGGRGPELAATDARLDLEAALDRLKPQQLLPLTLHYHLDLPIADVAQVLGCSPGAAKVRIHRALRALHPLLQLEVGT